jgi:anti-anti-sigma factor
VFRDKPAEAGTWIEHGPLSIRTEREPAELFIVEFYGELDLAGTEVAAKVLRDCAQADVEEIIVDLSALQFIDSSGLNVLVESFQRERENGNRLRFLRGPDSVQRVMELTCLDSALPFAD